MNFPVWGWWPLGCVAKHCSFRQPGQCKPPTQETWVNDNFKACLLWPETPIISLIMALT